MQKTIIIKNLNKLEEIAVEYAKDIQYPSVFLISGDLGSGKTAFTKAFAKALGVEKHVTSPTFLLHKSYDFKKNTLHHYDLYRLSKYEDLQEIGFEERIGKYIMIIEWPEKIKSLKNILKKDKNIKKIVEMHFYHTKNKNTRKVIINE